MLSVTFFNDSNFSAKSSIKSSNLFFRSFALRLSRSRVADPFSGASNSPVKSPNVNPHNNFEPINNLFKSDKFFPCYIKISCQAKKSGCKAQGARIRSQGTRTQG